MIVEILVVSNDGIESVVEFDLNDDLNTIVKNSRTPNNRMVCILKDGECVLRWDRDYFSRQENHWKKVDIDKFETLGSIERTRQDIKLIY
ncbi:type IV pilus biogenesis protein PilI [Pectobacterium versatile]|uniref:type IV pilus biogenesis protein PilI n=1 Tax=Pectobacterium versatile TaxID=2488639 RepID=UPI001F3A0674|nr:pilus assembly protein PilI [Pectobacterium versatile]